MKKTFRGMIILY